MSQVSCHVQYPVNLVPIPRFPLQPQRLLPAEIPLLRHRGGEHLPPTYSHGPPDESELLLSSFDRSRRPSVAHRECVAEDPGTVHAGPVQYRQDIRGKLQILQGDVRSFPRLGGRSGSSGPLFFRTQVIGAHLVSMSLTEHIRQSLPQNTLYRKYLSSSILTKTGSGRDQLPNDHILLEDSETVRLSFQRCIRQYFGGVLKGGG